MPKEIEINIHPDNINDSEFIKIQTAKKLKLNRDRIKGIKYLKKSIDSRSRVPLYKLRLLVQVDKLDNLQGFNFNFKNVSNKPSAIIVGGGPGGLFAALTLIENGIKPIVLERGKDISGRRKDIRKLHLESIVNTESNYCFGEGGAGTFSDGKLYTRSTKKGDVGKVLNLLNYHGAVEDILFDSHPHIGSNKLPDIIRNIRKTILEFGGEFYFDSKVTDLIIKDSKILGVIVNDNKEYLANSVMLATGHSARDIYYLLNKHSIRLEAKNYAMGVRIEHPQALIDSIQYRMPVRHPNLPAASYNLVQQVDGKGVFSFCMCPGGILVPSATNLNEIVMNGMSVSRRDSKFANSGLVVTVDESDWKDYSKHGVFAGLEFQKAYEQKAYEFSNESQNAPFQYVTDFIKKRVSNRTPITSYKPGLYSAQLDDIIPHSISYRLRKALFEFDKKMKGYISDEAILVAPESRTSSPIRIPRNNETLMNEEIEGLFPVGEGAGFAGGIVSAAMDGINSANAIIKFYNL